MQIYAKVDFTGRGRRGRKRRDLTLVYFHNRVVSPFVSREMRINTWSRSFLLSFDSRRLSRKCNVTLLTHRSRAPAPGTRFTRVINYSRNLTLFLKNYQLSRCRYIHGQFLQSISRSDLLYLNRLSKSSIKI